MRNSEEGGQGTFDPNRGQTAHRLEEQPPADGRLVINMIIGGPHPADKSWKEMERYANSLKHEEFECYSNMEDGAPAKQQRTMTDDIVFRASNADRVESPTTDLMVISSLIGHALVKQILIDCGSSVNIIL